MIQIVFMRHGDADPVGTDGNDKTRPLSTQGRRQVERICNNMMKSGFKPDMIVSSTATRASSTAALVHKQFPDCKTVSFHDGLYLADLDGLLAEVSEIDAAGKTIVFIGHNPGWSDIVSSLTGHMLLLGPGDACCCRLNRNEPLGLALTAIGKWEFLCHFK